MRVARHGRRGYCPPQPGTHASGLADSILQRRCSVGVSPLIRRSTLFAALLLFGASPAMNAGAQNRLPPAPQRTGIAQGSPGQVGVPARPAAPSAPAPAARPTVELQGGAITAIRVEGAQRIEESTVRSYLLVSPGDAFDSEQVDRSLKTLYATGLFSDVSITRQGSTLVVKVVENPLVNRVIFEGDHKLNDETLRPEIQLRPRAVFTPAAAQTDRQRLLDLYARRGRFAARIEPKIIMIPDNRVDVVFEIMEGDSTLVSRIAFVGNHAFSEDRLAGIIGTRESAFWRFLSTSDGYDPDRVNFDKELLRRYYLQKGYADFNVVSVNAELAPDRTAFFLTYTLSEGERYRIGKVDLNVTLAKVDKKTLTGLVEPEPGDWYDGDAVERSTQALTTQLQNHGFAFAEVKARIQRDAAKHVIDLVFDVGGGPRVYVERIDIIGNQRTADKVLRREFKVAEGDPFNAALVRRTRQRLQDLDYFGNVEINTSPGTTPDKVILTTNVTEKSTGELSIGGGYSTDIGALLNVGLRERNLIGTGIDGNLSGVLAQKESQIDFSMTDPYFLDRNIVAGFDIFHTDLNNQSIASYNERRTGFTVSTGYEFNEHLRQSVNYSLVQRDVYNIQSGASIYVQDEAGRSVLSQIGQTLTLDYTDSRVAPHNGFIIRLGTDFAGIGGSANFIRSKIDVGYYIPLDRFTGNTDWTVVVNAGAGYLYTEGKQEHIIDRFFLGGDNLRGFATGGAGPHSQTVNPESLGGRQIYTQSTELRFPLPVSPDLGLTGRAFVDIGALSNIGRTLLISPGPGLAPKAQLFTNYPGPRVSAGLGISWKTPFGLINIDLAQPIIKKKYDQAQLFRFGFGTRF